VTQLRYFVIGALLISTFSVGLTGFISDGLSLYNAESQVDTGKLDRLNQIDNSTQLADKAQTRAENVNAKSDFFTLPGLIKTLKLAFDSIALWDVFITESLALLGLAKVSWLQALLSGAVVLTVSFMFAQRVLN